MHTTAPYKSKFRSRRPAVARAEIRRPVVKRSPRPLGPAWIEQIDDLQQGFGLTQLQMAMELLHCSPRSLILWRNGRRPGAGVLIRLNELSRLLEALGQLMPAEDIGEWMRRTNEYLEPLTPLEVINRGQMDRLWRIVHDVGSGMVT